MPILATIIFVEELSEEWLGLEELSEEWGPQATAGEAEQSDIYWRYMYNMRIQSRNRTFS